MAACGSVSALLTAAIACAFYAVFLRDGQQQQPVLEDGQQQQQQGYELGSGKMFDSIATRYDLINKVQQGRRV